MPPTALLGGLGVPTSSQGLTPTLVQTLVLRGRGGEAKGMIACVRPVISDEAELRDPCWPRGLGCCLRLLKLGLGRCEGRGTN